ncbi:MAG: phosphodiesterase [Desulfobulbaceae bacterium A2]|nr:MAG: phosphodiesterase [Desulfobulbaceae bacterium A2]
MLFAQLSDTHIKAQRRLACRRVDSSTMLEACIRTLNRLKPAPDLVVITGDLTEFGAAEEYAALRDILAALKAPLLVVPGNHDEREAMRAAFADAAYLPATGFLHFVIDEYPLRLIGLDTLQPNQAGGRLCSVRLAWLEKTLARRAEAPTVIAMHHPPFNCGIEHMDKIALADSFAFADIISRHPQIELVLCGHLHRTVRASVGGLPVLACPSPAHQVELDLNHGAPSLFRMEPPGFMLHRWHDGTLVSHLAVIGDFAGPFPFFDDHGSLID